MNIYREIVKALKPVALKAEVHRIVSGGIYTAVEVTMGGGRALGLAYVEGEGCGGRGAVGCGDNGCLRGVAPSIDVGPALPVSAVELLADIVEISEMKGGEGGAAGTAASTALASALAQLTLTEWERGDVLEQLSVKRGERVTVVGGFPFTPRLVEMGAELAVFDREFGDFDEGKMGKALKTANVVIITGATIVNGTLPDVLKSIGGARDVIILGPTTPLIPAAFAGTPVTRLMGVIPTDIDGVIEVVASGGGTRAFGRYIQKVGVRVGK